MIRAVGRWLLVSIPFLVIIIGPMGYIFYDIYTRIQENKEKRLEKEEKEKKYYTNNECFMKMSSDFLDKEIALLQRETDEMVKSVTGEPNEYISLKIKLRREREAFCKKVFTKCFPNEPNNLREIRIVRCIENTQEKNY